MKVETMTAEEAQRIENEWLEEQRRRRQAISGDGEVPDDSDLHPRAQS